jgi:hypothetical protein
MSRTPSPRVTDASERHGENAKGPIVIIESGITIDVIAVSLNVANSMTVIPLPRVTDDSEKQE